jgi:phospholipid-translocating ATPase
MTEEKRTFEWASEAETAFQAVKDVLCMTLVLGYPRLGEKFIVDTDASNVGIDGVLSQVHDVERVAAYFSKTLSKAERNYCVRPVEQCWPL